MKCSSLFISSLFFLFIISPGFATTCPSPEKVHSAIEKFEVYLNGGSTNKGTNFMNKNINSKNKILFYFGSLESFKGAFYQEKTKDIKKSSLTCTYIFYDHNYFNLKLRDIDADAVDVTKFNKKYWKNFYGPGLYSCENNVSTNNCKFTLKNE
ncbi:hypothetical protein RVIR1_06280 [Candidatus Rickettsiella viridis]|uniref:Uncharacterized protein n=1 Tax=Candidatus Rickettsiella viridis TaxID=676208 RepID=A0A2Z5UUB2_9COXI|nr:hypothetical protein [Candidatus Rickettsiella viridis]BBB15129.1 hypothetical protein RVIR1_06280 [Candidatus Rickettsiella viridis]